MKNISAAHFIGIGGIGVSSVARMFLLQGKQVSGSDLSVSKITTELEKLGARISQGHGAKNIPENTELIVYTIAISNNNSEFLEAKKRGLPVLSYPELLGLISKDKYTIAVSGTHGKTTTTAMIAKILLDAQLDPTVIVGSFLLDEKSNFIAGNSDYFIVEACEYKRSFLNIHPKIIVITNIDNDHLDYYKDINDIQSAFREFVQKLPKDGTVVCNPADPLIYPVIEHTKAKIVDYTSYPKAELSVPGAHNLLNAQAAQAVGDIIGVTKDKTLLALSEFKGTWRRFEYKGEMQNGALVYDDYGHHPTEISATLSAARAMFPNKKLVVIFQPHLYSRTKILLPQFVESLRVADEVFLAPIYAAREKFDPAISSNTLAKLLSDENIPAAAFTDQNLMVQRIKKEFSDKNSLILTIGAGDIYKIGELLLSATREEKTF
ncbi:MAG: UDP-N-acetylmuramate--L-alanine ligase [bacterium]|nr:UDP-N-acetylmuramate--L-alanine ligase [bacterium]